MPTEHRWWIGSVMLEIELDYFSAQISAFELPIRVEKTGYIGWIPQIPFVPQHKALRSWTPTKKTSLSHGVVSIEKTDIPQTRTSTRNSLRGAVEKVSH